MLQYATSLSLSAAVFTLGELTAVK